MLPKPLGVYIQTLNKCNADCSICPQKKAQKLHGIRVMPAELFHKIIDELGEDYQGVIAPYLMFEPLMDDRIFDFIKYAKKHCPQATVEISTNGSLLDRDNQARLAISGIDRVHFNVGGATKETYEKRMKLNFETSIENIKSFKEVYDNVFINFVVSDDNKHEVGKIKELFPNWNITTEYWASNRAGNVDIKPEGKTRFSQCKLQDTDIYIVANGDVILCCNDYEQEVVFGNIIYKNLWYLWRNRETNYKRKICQRCL